MTPNLATPEAVARIVSENDYLRARIEPRPGDITYFHLSDLRRAMQMVATSEPLRILDYGCGGSPYRPLFPNAEYRRADLPDTAEIDYVLRPDGGIDEADGRFDLILSTQVLEHVAAPGAYLRECHRLLAPGGRLFLTTHGFYEEHGCPYDFHRWTSDGLRIEVEAAGFRSEAVHKLTTGGRALLQLIEHHGGGLFAPRWHPFGMWLTAIRWVSRHRRAALHRWSDRFHDNYRVVPAADPGHPFFLALSIRAVKP
ncbi:MAG TPA: methyltransferase domain-containing protein [Opitutaceae bacterium]|nr:methyltransferase domain-containing protein [Opitutaceae bacterium]